MVLSWRSTPTSTAQIKDYARARHRLVEAFGEGSSPVLTLHRLVFGKEAMPLSSDADPLDDDLPASLAPRIPASGRPLAEIERREAAAARREAQKLYRFYEEIALTGESEEKIALMARRRAAHTRPEPNRTPDEALIVILDFRRLEADRIRRRRLKARKKVTAAEAQVARWVAAAEAYRKVHRTAHWGPASAITQSIAATRTLQEARAALATISAELGVHNERTKMLRATILPIVTATIAGEPTGWRIVKGRLIDSKGRDYPYREHTDAASAAIQEA